MTRGKTWAVALGVTLAIAAGMVAAVLSAGFTWFNCFSGDGGDPYVAPSSEQGEWCSAIDNRWFFVLFGAPLVLGTLIATWAAVHWRAGGSTRWLIAALLAPALLTGVGFYAFHKPDDYCSDAQYAAYDAWDAQPQRERSRTPPYDCARY